MPGSRDRVSGVDRIWGQGSDCSKGECPLSDDVLDCQVRLSGKPQPRDCVDDERPSGLLAHRTRDWDGK